MPCDKHDTFSSLKQHRRAVSRSRRQKPTTARPGSVLEVSRATARPSPGPMAALRLCCLQVSTPGICQDRGPCCLAAVTGAAHMPTTCPLHPRVKKSPSHLSHAPNPAVLVRCRPGKTLFRGFPGLAQAHLAYLVFTQSREQAHRIYRFHQTPGGEEGAQVTVFRILPATDRLAE